MAKFKKKSKTIKRNHCCNPFNHHKRWQIKNLRSINHSTAKKASVKNIALVVGEHICTSCLNGIKKKASNVSHDISDQQQTVTITSDSDNSSSQESKSSDAEFVEYDVASIVKHLNAAIENTGIEPIDASRLRYQKYAMEKQNQLVQFLASHVFKVATDSSEMIEQLQQKFEATSSHDDKIKVLSIVPKSWTPHKVASTFNIPIYMARKTKNLVQINGILCGVQKKIGSKTLSDDTVKKVQDFYRSDEISRLCPGLRDYVTVTDEGEKQCIQRRLVLMNLKEAFVKFKEQTDGYKIGFSKFAELRPPECVLALEKYGTHTSCVCPYHQNFKLLFSSLKKMDLFADCSDFRGLLVKATCKTPSDDCRFDSCEQCYHRISSIGNDIRYQLQEISLLEKVTIKQWTNISGKINEN